MWTPIKLKLQSYLDPSMSDIALIIGPPYMSTFEVHGNRERGSRRMFVYLADRG